MERRGILMCGVVGLLGLISSALAIAAEATKIKASQIRRTSENECVYPKTPASTLGLFSTFSLVMAHVIIYAVAGCICCKRRPYPPNTNCIMWLISFTTSWITFIIAFVLLLRGASLNDQGQERDMSYYTSSCNVAKPGVFSSGAFLGLSSIALGIIYYVTSASTKGIHPVNGHQLGDEGGIVMGQPHIPPQSTEVVFMYEDAYNR